MLRGTMLALLGMLFLTGCVERARVVTVPNGARVYLDKSEVGVTPYVFSVERDKLRDFSYRVELDGYRSAEGILRKRVAPGRAVGAAFTLGILYLFRSPYYIESTKQVLAFEPQQWRQPAESPRIEDRLKKLQELHNDGVLNDQEYQQQKARMLEQSR